MALPPPDSDGTCLITGASAGIGADVARELAQRGLGVTLVARREERLHALAEELRSRFGVRAEAIGCDLADGGARDEMVAEVAERGLTVEVLVNNAGFGSGGLFHQLDQAVEVNMVRLNVEAVVALCGRYVPSMVERGRGAVLNVASIAGYQPIPRQATYSASKSFVLTFTEALASELTGTGVTATALCPGPVTTEFSDVAGIAEAAASSPSFVWMTAADTARAGVEGLEKGRRTVVPGPLNLVSSLAGRHTPRSVLLPLYRRFYPVGR